MLCGVVEVFCELLDYYKFYLKVKVGVEGLFKWIIIDNVFFGWGGYCWD